MQDGPVTRSSSCAVLVKGQCFEILITGGGGYVSVACDAIAVPKIIHISTWNVTY